MHQDRRGSVVRDKALLRARMGELLGGVNAEERARMAEAAKDRLLALDAFGDRATVMLFHSSGSEIPTAAVIEALAEEGHRILLPFVDRTEIQATEFTPGDELMRSPYGPMEPSRRKAVPAEDLDVMILPGLAFDREGYRLGHGGGHYDRFLARAGLRALLVGLGFHFQVVDRVPRDRNDRPVHLVVTDAESVWARPHV